MFGKFQMLVIFIGGSRPSHKGGPGHPAPEIRGVGWEGGAVYKKLFSALRASVWSKNKGSQVTLALPLDPPLILQCRIQTLR